jgi:hypothetical protein
VSSRKFPNPLRVATWYQSRLALTGGELTVCGGAPRKEGLLVGTSSTQGLQVQAEAVQKCGGAEATAGGASSTGSRA